MEEIIKNIKSDQKPLNALKEAFNTFTEGKFEDDISLIEIKFVE